MPASPPILGSTGSTTLVLAVLLVALGVAMIVISVWLVRATRTDPPALGPLEVMGTRSWLRQDAGGRADSLAAARADDAPPPAPMLDVLDSDEAVPPGEAPERDATEDSTDSADSADSAAASDACEPELPDVVVEDAPEVPAGDAEVPPDVDRTEREEHQTAESW